MAVAAGDRSLTYGALDRRAERLASALRAAGVGPEVLVGLCARRSPEMVVAILAVLKAGGAYLPLDSSAPRERLAFMVEDAGAPVVLVETGLDAVLPAFDSRRVRTLRLGAEAPAPAAAAPGGGAALLDAGHLAYVIYTSGSTGRPKGSWISHGNVGALLDATARRVGPRPDDVWTLFHSYAFDFSVWELWGALAFGGRLELVDPWVGRSPEAFRELLRDRRVTVLNQTPSAFKQLVSAETAAPASPPGALRLVIFGGEALEPSALAPWIDRHGDRRPRLVNMYGITETTIHVTYRPLGAGDLCGGSGSPIGAPIPHLAVHVLDPDGRPVPLGVPAELHVGGPGLARGYLDRAALTAERFVPDPFAAAAGSGGARLYRAGDLARRTPAGELEFLGRIDHQVKVRGFRIELGEVEAALSRHPAVDQAAVVAREREAGDRQLVAYVVCRAGAALRAAELRAHCGGLLPDYMVPGAWVELAALPLTANGKLDRKALPEPKAAAEPDARRPAPPQGWVEAAVASAVSEVLGAGPVGRDDDFFALGGHSLLAARLVSRLRTRLGVELPVRAVFEDATVAGIAGRVVETLGTAAAAPPIEALAPGERRRGVPLSLEQQRLWVLEALGADDGAYTVAGALRLSGALDLRALAGAFTAVVRRQEALRTLFRQGPDEPLQVAVAPWTFRLPVVDLRALRGPLRDAAAKALARRESRRRFDLSQGPLVRALAVRSGAAEHLLVMTLHHIVSDAWSLGVLVRELGAAYGGLRSGRAPAAPSLPVQYGDYAVWQRRRLADGALQSRLAYWREHLAGLAELALPTDRRRPAERSGRGRVARGRIDAPLAAALARRARAAGASPFMVLVAGLQALLGLWAGQEDVAVGSPVANRPRPETEDLVGFFVNTLVLRGDLSGAPTLGELLARVRETTLAAYAHQDVPFDRVVEELAPRRELSRTPLFQVMLAFQAAPPGPVSLPGLRVEELALETGTAKFDLTLDLKQDGDGLAMAAEYDADLFDGTTIDRLLERYRRVLAAFADEPETRLGALPLLGRAERHQLLIEANEGSGRQGPWTTLSELFERRAAAVPEAVAVVSRGRCVTYRELARRSRALAARLAARGIGPGTRAAVCLERTPDLVAALLGVLRAGAAYVPLDPAYPGERVAFMVEDSGAAAVVSSQALRPRLAELLPGIGARDGLVLVPAAFGERAAGAGEPAPRPRPDDLSHLIYTSGSTGRPKGVAIEHRSAAARVAWALDAFAPDELDGVLASTSVCFDLSLFELFAPLASGGRVVLVDDALDLAGHPEAGRVTLLNTVPSAMTELLRLEAVPPSVRVVNLAGEPLKAALAERIHALTAAGRVLDLYGPSEDTTYSTCGRALPGEGREPSIGRPLPGTRAYVLDAALRPVARGTVGELHLGGAGQSRGYHRRPALTAASYLPDPFAGSGAGVGARLYRTGDLVRHLADGRLELLGRADHQVKLRGFRIELGEVEAALAGHPAVADCAAAVRGEGAAARLVAFVELREDAAAGADDLRSYLRSRLPAPMVPAVVTVLASLPRTPNGKTDRRALATLAPAAPERGPGREPEGELERAVARVFHEVLGRSSVGADDDFFELGGHSLLATRVVARLRRALSLELRPRQVFELRTVRALAATLSGAAVTVGVPPLCRRERDGEAGVALSPAQERLWFLDRYEPGSAQYSIPGGMRLRGELRAAALGRALGGIVARHEALRTRFEEVAGEARQRVEGSVALALPVVNLSRLAAERREAALGELGRRQAARPFDLGRSPLLRATLVRLAPDDHALVVVMHHIVSDGWSFTVLARELSALYGAAGEGQPERLAEGLPKLPVQYPDYAVWQRRVLSGEVVERELGYWRERLAGLPALELPGDRPRPAVRSGRGETVGGALPGVLARSIAAFGRERAASPFHVLMAGFQAVLARWSGEEDFGVGTPVANRTRPEVEDLVGLFVNTLVVRARPEARTGFGALVGRVREASVEALGHQELPLELVVEALAPARDPSRTPLFQVVFGFVNEPAAFELSGLRVEPFDVATGTAKFDLTLNLLPAGEGISGTLEASADLFDRTTVERLWGHLATLLAAGVAEPERPLGSLALLSRAERHQVALEWAGGPSGYPREATLAELFARQAGRRSDAVAVELGERALSYGELARRAGRLARELRSAGVGPEVPVGLLLERSVEMIVATVAVAAAGGCYAPLDPEYPRERLEHMLGETRAPVVLAHRRLARRVPGLLDGAGGRFGGAVIELDGWDQGGGPAAAAGAAEPLPEPAAPAAGPESLAYVMYTSGSTGRPKGVAVPQRAVARLVLAADFARLDEAETFLQLAPTPFDAATLEIWGPLLNGGRLVVMPPGPVGFDELGRVLAARRVSTLWLTAGLFHRMVEEELPALAGVRQLLAGGDVLSPPHVRRVLAAHPGVRVIDGYGPTENTTFTTCFPMASAREVPAPVPIGRPIADTAVVLLGRGLESVPAGVPGELHAAGDGLARGYLGRPGATAAVFLPHPGGAAPGERVYRTGDLARWRRDGAIEFLGRRDGQVKLRGFRIELGEVEAALAAHPDVEEAVAVARRDAAGEAHLVAYAVPTRGRSATPEGLREHLAVRLPAFMVPAAVVLLDALPLDPNGKVDRRALPAPAEAAPASGPAGAAAETPAEALVARVFGDVLGLDRVPLDQGFFDLGGHSLQAARVASRLRRELGRDVPLRLLFERPTARALAAALGDLAASAGPPLERQVDDLERRAGVPLSPAQERLWFLDRYEPGSAQYSIPGGMRLRGELRAAALGRALRGIVARHEALRTRFEEVAGEARQRVEESVALALPVVDLSRLAAERREAVLGELGRRQAARPFDLGRSPLLRSTLVRLAPDDHALVVVMHHIVSDGWSFTVLARELAALYRAESGGTAAVPDGLPALPVQYPDYAVWQRRVLSGEVREREVDFWRERLAGLPAIELPGDRPRPPVRSGRGEAVRGALSPPLARAVAQLGRRREASPFHVLMAAFQAVLGRWSGQEDFGVGTPVANRSRRETEDLVGFFVNTVVLRARPEAGTPFGELVGRVRESAVEALGHQELPLELVVEALAPVRDPSRTPLFQVMLGLFNEPAVFELPGLRVEPFDVESGTAKLDLTLNLRPAGEGIAGLLEASADLFDRTTAERLWRHVSTLLAAGVADPGRAAGDLPVLSAAERHQVAAEWAGDASAYPRDASLAELFAAQAERRSDAVAVELGERAVSYGELARRAGRLAGRLRRAGIAPGSVVGLCFERGPELIEAMLGALHAGAVYLPLDPSYPANRLAFMIEDAGAAAVVAAPETAGALPADVRPLVLSAEPAAGSPPPPAEVHPLQAANVIYTSGSTGRPKGVLVTHRGVVRLVIGTDHLQVAPGERMSFGSNIAFDAATLEIWSALGNGACLVGIGRDVLLDPLRLAQHVADRRLSVAFFTTALFNQVAREAPGALAGLETVAFGGEAADPRAARAVLRSGAPGRLLNLYGPAENATLSTWHRIAGVRDGAGVPIGRAVSNSTVHVFDRRFRSVPAGVPGELFVGGDGLATGYLRRPGLTAERFVPHPGPGRPGERLYATGDLVRRRPVDGALAFLGRADHQVKIRGFRVEPDEVASVLVAHPDLAEALVVVREDAPGGRRLVAYAVPRPGATPGAGALRDHLRQVLPPYMIPSAFVTLEALPLTPNGKVDRRALPAPDPEAGGARGSVAPRTPMEELVAGVFAEVLGVASVGAEDAFFELGGHSLLAVRVASRLSELVGGEVPLRLLFEQPTVSRLAEALAGFAGAGAGAPPLVRRERPDDGAAPLSYSQERLWILDRIEPGSTAYGMPVAIRLRGRLDRPALARALGRLVARHESLRTRFAAEGGRPVQRVVAPRSPGLPVVDLESLPPPRRSAALEAALEEASERPFDLARGPLLRTLWIREGEASGVLHLLMHHIVSDGWSVGILIRETAALYRAELEARAPELPELPVQYADYSRWQREWLGGETRETQLAYWRERLAGAPAATELPLDRPRPAVRSFVGGRRSARLDPERAAALRRLAGERRATLFMVLLAAFYLLLQRLSGQDDLVLGSPVAGRGRREVEGLIGMFLNTLVLRADLAGDPSFVDLLLRVRETALGAYAHQDVPFEMLLDELEVARDLSRTPFFQVFFNMLELPMTEGVELPGAVLEPVKMPELASKFDLTLYVGPRDGGLAFDAVFDAGLFDRGTVERFLDQYLRILDQVLEDPARRIGSVSLLDPAAVAALPDPRAALSGTWQGSIQAALARAARETPDRVAVVDPERTWTYEALASRSGRIAGRLHGAGVGAGDRVAVFSHRSAPLAAAILGVLHAGAAFVVLDPAYPGRRLADMVGMARPRALVWIEGAGELPPDLVAELAGVPRLTVGAEAGPEDGPPAPVPAEVGPDDPAYVAFTSGSTGRPKGILGRHGSLTHFLPWQCRRFGLGPDDRFSVLSGLAHDPLHRDLFTPVWLGAAMVVPDPLEMGAAGRLARWLGRERVTVSLLTPAMAQLITERPPGGPAPRARDLGRVFLVGDVLTLRDVERLRDLAPAVACVNLYGSTETQRAVAYHEIAPGPPAAGTPGAERGRQVLPLGRGMEDVQLVVLHRGGGLSAVGEVGEICVRSPHLALGYLDDPELTARRFVRNPFAGDSDDASDRLYRTGDLGRYTADGEVVFLGRADDQVKIRGFRIELGEVQASLAAAPGVREAAVLVKSDGPGGPRLVGYVVPEPGAPPPLPAGLRSRLEARLPSYMVPAGFAVLDQIPLTPNRKVDRRALAQIDDSSREVRMSSRPPQTRAEQAIAEIVRDVLELDTLRVEDNFFDLGGNSLLLVQVHGRLEADFGRTIPMVALFNHPTVESLAAYLSPGSEGGAPRPASESKHRLRTAELKAGRDRLKGRLQRKLG